MQRITRSTDLQLRCVAEYRCDHHRDGACMQACQRCRLLHWRKVPGRVTRPRLVSLGCLHRLDASVDTLPDAMVEMLLKSFLVNTRSLVLATTSLACSWIGLYLVFAGSALVGYRGVDSAKRAIMVGEPYFTVYRYAGRTLTGFGVLAGLPWAVYVVSTLLGTGVLDKGCSGLSIG